VPADSCGPAALNRDIKRGGSWQNHLLLPESPTQSARGASWRLPFLPWLARKLFPDHEPQLKPMSIRALRPGYH
jgi:hypothetical protein